jgi:PEP-CTERM motif
MRMLPSLPLLPTSHRHLAAMVFLMLVEAQATAAPVTHAFSGTATEAIGSFAGQGTAVTGFYTLDPDNLTFDDNPDPVQDLWRADQNQAATWEISVTLGAVTVTSADNANTAGTRHHHLQITDVPQADQWTLEATPHLPGDLRFRLFAHDERPIGAPDGIAAGSNDLNVAPILTPGDLSAYTYTRADVHDGDASNALVFTLDSVVLVPEPTTALLFASGLAALALARRRR